MIVNESLNVDNVITYDSKKFNTIVIRIFDETTEIINLNELQCWVNDINIMVLPTNNLNTYFANWSNKDVPLTGLGDITGLYNEIIEEQYGAHSNNPSINALIVKDIPLTFISK